ncbi:MAG: GNAT family N-acetyltransferase [Anaerolineae bacterium]|nr:GNAT family N-acetyltransferase [Anaerolineae bacterium]
MYIRYPRQRDNLAACWEQGSTVLVVTNKPKSTPTLVGVRPESVDSSVELTDEDMITDGVAAPVFAYCQLDAEPWHKTGWITHLIVDRPYRKRGIGTALLKASVAWGKSKKLERLMIAVQTKNYPAISFCEKHNLLFCGFNDHYYVNRDIALFFTLRINGTQAQNE